MSGRRGASIAEALLALVVGGILVAGMVSAVRAVSQAVADQTRRSESAEVLRTVWSVLDEELSVGVPGRDWSFEGERAVVVRAFRGLARVCGQGEGPGELDVAWRGHRAPDPDRDSLLALRSDGSWLALELLEVRAGGGCTPEAGEAAGRWRPGAGPEGESETGHAAGGAAHLPVVLRYFESGRYSLEEGAFRYRRGAGGRQPLTPERLGPGSRFTDGDEGPAVRLELEPGGAVEWRLPRGPGADDPGEGTP